MAHEVRPGVSGAAVPGAGGLAAAGATAEAEPAPFISQIPGTPTSFPTYHGRPVSWVAVGMIMVSFLVGGLALVFGPTWWLFWASVALAAVGALLALATNIFEDWY